MAAQQGTCRSCRAPILWARTENVKAMPLTLPAAEDGNTWIDQDGVAHVESLLAPCPEDAPRYRPHFADCPNWTAGRGR